MGWVGGAAAGRSHPGRLGAFAGLSKEATAWCLYSSMWEAKGRWWPGGGGICGEGTRELGFEVCCVGPTQVGV